MIRAIAVMLACVPLMLLVGCKKGSKSAATGTSAATGSAAKGSGSGTGSGIGDKLANSLRDKIKGAKKKRVTLTAEEYEKLVVGLKGCRLTKHGRIDRNCEGYKKLSEARSHASTIKDFAGKSQKLGIKLLSSPDEAVRWYAAGLLKSFFGARADSQAAVLKAATSEKSPFVLARMIYAIGRAASTNPAIAALLMKMTDHSHKLVRKEALAYLAGASGVKGRFEKFAEKIEKDPEMAVRRYACRYAGRLGDERLVPIYKKATARVTVKLEPFYADCMRGLFTMWNPFIGKHKLSAAAYALTLKRIKRRPRSQSHPPWIMMSDFGRRPRGKPAWYKEAQVTRMLVGVAFDRRARWLARTGAARALGKLGAKKQLETLRKKLSGKKDFDSKNVLKVVKKQLSRLS